MRWLVAGWLVIALVACGDNEPCTSQPYFADRDGDGFGDPAIAMDACEPPSGFVANADDCDDDCNACAPSKLEVCDGLVDENCDGSADEGCACVNGTEQPCPSGSDVGSCRVGTQVCSDGVWQACDGRVEPTDEVCNDADDDCDGMVDGQSAVGACGVAAHSTAATCSNGECIAVCAPGFEDCNASYADGCESDLGVPATCGGCNTQCAIGLACELGDCVQLPELVWSTPVEGRLINYATIASIADDGDVFVGGPFQIDPVDLGAFHVDPDPSGSQDVWLARMDPAGAPRWLIRDGNVGAVETPHRSRYSSLDDRLYLSGGWAGSSAIAGDVLSSVPCCTEQGAFLAAYQGSDGAGHWARVTTNDFFSGAFAPVPGVFGIDVASGDSANRRVKRFDFDGNLVFDIPTIQFTVPAHQASDGRVIAVGSGQQSHDSNCVPTGVTGQFAMLLSLDPSGQCTLLRELAGMFVQVVRPRPGGGFVLSGALHGTFGDPDFPLTTRGFDALLVALHADGNVEWVHHVPTGDCCRSSLDLDDRGNVYWTMVTSETSAEVTLRSFRDDGVERWSVAIGPVARFGATERFAVNANGDIALVLAADGDLAIGSTIIPGTGPHQVIAKLRGR